MTVTITLYGRKGCHLCDQARSSILKIAGERDGIELRELDIDRDQRLLAAYLERIPVVEVSGREISELELDTDALRVALAHTVGP